MAEDRKHRRFFITFLAAFLGILFLVGGVNYYVDPYMMNNQSRVKGVNFYKPAFHLNTRKWKLFRAANIDPNIIFLGNSRVEYLAPEQVFNASGNVRSFNFGFSGATSVEMADVLRYSISSFELDTVYYMVDFVSVLNHVPEYREGFDTELYAGERRLFLEAMEVYLSSEALRASWECIQSNRNDPGGHRVTYQYNPNGSRTNRWRNLQLEEKGDAWLTGEFERIQLQYEDIYNRSDIAIDRKKQNAVHEIKELCDQNKIPLKIVVLPLYASQYESLMTSVAFSEYMVFLQQLVDEKGFYYFGGINEYTSDRSYYWDTQHPRNNFAEVIFSYIWKQRKSADPLFGQHVDSSNIEKLLTEIRDLRSAISNKPAN